MCDNNIDDDIIKKLEAEFGDKPGAAIITDDEGKKPSQFVIYDPTVKRNTYREIRPDRPTTPPKREKR